jgi:uncharacterized protein (DUF924 family)
VFLPLLKNKFKIHEAKMEAQAVLDYWFGKADFKEEGLDTKRHRSAAEIAQQQSKLWWSKNKSIDLDIRQSFEPTLKALLTGQYSSWFETPQGRLAAIIVLDQFSRNMYRDSAHAFSQDSLALYWALQGIRQGDDKKLTPLQRVFFYLPLEHCEQLSMQDLAIEKFSQLADDAPASFSDLAKGFVDYAHQHQEVIAHFGRFPHRNHLLGRLSTKEEKEYLAKPGTGF